MHPKALCSSSDILAAIDDAVHDKVDVISVSLGGSFPHLPEVSPDNALAIGSFHAVAHGIPVISAAGNEGSLTSSVEEVAPWMISVAASTVDRAFPTITLGNNKTWAVAWSWVGGLTLQAWFVRNFLKGSLRMN